MKKNQSFSLVLASLFALPDHMRKKPDPKYFNEVPPGTTPVVFARGKVSMHGSV
jgi:hypothetical protein